MSASYRTYRLEYELEVQDPDVPGPRFHNVIFVETNADGSGQIHHVTGDLVTGMIYQVRSETRPEVSEGFHRKYLIGTISRSDYPDKVDEILKKIPAPPVQKSFNLATMRTEQHKSPGVFYAPGEPRPPMIKCTEWTIDQAIPALLEKEVIQP
ncbi:hypothetical protein Dda_1433 [Drechslerella dactyloides]|uniref:Uncharacterized protein n=1 Tax=Drechslerella dactyloides TaxID=74499 RepID=A0AAD6J656_DREDA|nr:hypothetical protein Dda_1433 [Drechslerella dactyloides]